jgi:hypothetical protein
MIPSLVLKAARATGRPRFFDMSGKPLLGGHPQGQAFVLSAPVTSERLVVTAAHLAVEANAIEVATADLQRVLVRGSGRRVAPAEIALVNDFVAFVAQGSGPSLSLAPREPEAAEAVFVLAAPGTEDSEPIVLSGTVAEVSEEGTFLVSPDPALDPDEIESCVGAPIVDAAGKVVGLCVSAPERDGRRLLASPRLEVLRTVLSSAPSA